MSSVNKLKKKRAVTPPTSTSATGASTSTAGHIAVDDSLISEDALRSASTALEALKSVGDAAAVLGPLKTICGVLKIVVDTAVLLKNNGEDLRDLVDKLGQHQHFIETEITKLSEPEYSKSNNVEEITRPLQNYLLHLQKLYNQLEALKARYEDKSKRKRAKTALKAQSDQAEIVDCVQSLEDSFRQFMNAMTSFIARQTLLLRNEMAVLHESMTEMSSRLAEKDAKDALEQLAYADARGNQHSRCMEGTREALLEIILNWATNDMPIFALIDQAGTGKSTIAAHMARQWEKDGLLLARYFFSKPSTVTGKDLASTVAREIAEKAPALRPIIVDALNKHPNFAACSIQEQLEWIVFEPLKSLETTRILVVDALDECSKEDRGVFLKHLLDFISSYPIGSCPLKILLTCRPEDDLTSRLRQPRYATLVNEANFQLRPAQHPSNEADIRLYAMALLSNFLTDEQIDEFVSGAKGLFIWASTTYGFLVDALDPTERFEALMKKNLTLELLYEEIISNALKRVAGQEGLVVKVLQAICVSREPLTAEMIDELLGLRSGVAGRVVMMLSSVLSDGNQGKPVHVLHPTFLEYLLDPNSCQLEISNEGAEALVARGCLSVCLNRLKYDICDIHHPPHFLPFNKAIKNLEMLLRERTTPAFQYAATNVLSHVASSLHNREVVDRLRYFFNDKLLNWIELMSLHGKIYSLIQSVQYLKTRIEKSLRLSTNIITAGDLDWCSQTLSMVQAFQGVIEESAMQVYFSALPFEPKTSRIALCYLPQFAGSILKVICGVRDPQSQSRILCGHTKWVGCISYAPAGHVIASGAADGTVRLWDPTTGAAIAILTGHTDKVNCLEFSPDDKRLASGAHDGTVRLWDPATAATLAELTGHRSNVLCLAFSPDGKMLASGSDDRIVRLWDPIAGIAVAELSGHTNSVNHLTFSPNSKILASGSFDKTVRLWSPSTGAVVAKLIGHTNWINCLAFSPDSKILASGSVDKTVRIWNPSMGAVVATLTRHTNEVSCLVFSPDGKILASGSHDNTLRLWDATTNKGVAELTGHTSGVVCLAFSPDANILASGSYDNTVRLWDPNTGTSVAKLIGHTDTVRILKYSPDGKMLASGSHDTTVRLWNLNTSEASAMSTSHAGTINCLALSPDSKTLAIGPHNNTVQLWDSSTGIVVAELTGHADYVSCITFSPDGKMLASGSHDNTVRLWNPATRVSIAKLTGHTGRVNCLQFSPDGKMLASGSKDTTVWYWDPATGTAVAKLTGHTESVSCLAFSPDGEILASGSKDSTVRLWDSKSGQVATDPLVRRHYDGPAHPADNIEFLEFRLQNGRLLLLADYEGKLRALWNLSTNPPSRHSGYGTLIPAPPWTSSPIQFIFPWTYIPTAGILFQLPPYFPNAKFCSNGGKAAYGGQDGSVIIVDCSHLI